MIWAAGMLATFGVGIVLARWLGPAGYGIYGSAVAIVAILAVPAQMGLPLLATREVSAMRSQATPADVAALGWWFAAIVLAASVILAGALWLAKDFLPLHSAIRPAMTAAAALLPVLALSSLAAGLLRGQERVVTSQLIDVLLRPLFFLAALLAWSQPFGATQGLFAQVVATTCVAVIGLGLFLRGLPRPAAGAAHRVRGWTAAALPMTVLDAMRAIEGGYAVLIAGYAASIVDAGLLRVAIASSVLVSLPISLQSNITGPFLAAAYADGTPERLTKIVAASTLFMSVATAAALLLLTVVGPWAIPMAFGAQFGGAYIPLLVLGANQLVTAFCGPGVMLLSMTGHERTVARAYITSVLSGVLVALVLTPMFGVTGTAASMIVVTVIRAHMLNRHARAALGVEPSLRGAIQVFGGLRRVDPELTR
jgi:O-antigen/teichoic acid export membrane protein